MSTQHWTVITKVRQRTRNGVPEDVPHFELQFKGRTMMEAKDELTRQSYEKQAQEWNSINYIPKANGGECLADHPPEKRSEVLKRMKNSTEAFPNLIIDVDSNRAAYHKFKNSALGPRS